MDDNKVTYNELDHQSLTSLKQLGELLAKHNCNKILIKKLAKNNNDKNQVYFHHDASILNSVFDLTFHSRPASRSLKKGGKIKGSLISEAVFNSFSWLSIDGNLYGVDRCKGILYLQYPEVRLSGFKSWSGVMPASMSVNFVKSNPNLARYLAIGATPEGKAIAVMIVDFSNEFYDEFQCLSFIGESKICRLHEIPQGDASARLKSLLSNNISGKNVKGCRLSVEGKTLPFTGTQVHGYTLEHELGIRTNASKGGDIFGIELKCFTSKKLTLFTPEPDGGLYAASFAEFMLKYGYAKEAAYRLSGLHRVGAVCEKSSLSLEVLCSDRKDVEDELINYNPELPLSHQMKNLQVVLRDGDEVIAASWSLERLMNNWGVKHNEVVYVPAEVTDNHVPSEYEAGFKKRVIFDKEVLWCKRTSLERMINSIASGVIFLDPAPKYDPDNPKNNKRRSQWRINDIYRDSKYLYEEVESVLI